MTYRPPIASRTWGTRFDSLLASPPISSPTCDSILDSTAADAAILNPVPPSPTAGKTPHDASIFVGSLPCNVDQAELSRLLSSHLAEHQEIRSVKVVRDSKGGICAFVQCEDASSASSLIQTLRSGPPRPFMGRILRYEPARAFRTLLISYRSPVQILASNGVGGRRQTIMLDLPYAMRLWKPKDNKYFNVVYNAEAVDIEKRYGGIPVSNRGSDARFFMHPVVFDVEAIRSIASFFGVLESFDRFKLDEATGQRVDITPSERQFFPFPHNGLRSVCMDSGCWEVKWRHRDDCVSALMTLKRIPHLTVTWAHQPQYATDRLATRHVKERKTTAAPHWSPTCELSNSPIPCILGGLQSTLSSPVGSNDEECDHARSIHQKSSFDYDLESDIDAIRKTEGVKLNWSDEDFGPAVDSQEIGTSSWGTWQDQKIDLAIDRKKTTYLREDQLDVASTPGLGMSPITQKSFGSGFPSTPTDLSGEISGFSADIKSRQENTRNMFKGKPVDPSTLFVGGLEMFGPNAWDEGKVRRCFEKYGALENVKFVRPYNSCSAFAFVKFKSIDGPTHAIQGEHNRVYEGRAIRVQLRECNVSRGTWKPPRSRGRPTSTYTINRHENAGIIKTLLNTDVQRQNQADIVPHVDVPGRTTEIEGRDGSLEFQSARSTNHGTQPLAETIQSEDKAETLNPIDSTAGVGNGNGPAQESLLANASQTNPIPLSMHPFAYHNFGYYPAPWFHPYLQQVQYQFPYYAGYPGYMMPLPMFRPPPPQSNADANTSASAQAPWHPSVNSYGSYMPYPQVARAQVTDTTTSYSQLPISSTGVDQAPVAVCQTEAIEQYPSCAQATASQPQANFPVWPQYPYQPFHYPGSLNANAKVFVPPPGMASTSSPVANARRQSGRKTHPGDTGGRAPWNRPFVGYTNGTTTNNDSPRDNRQAEFAKFASISADWM